MNISANWGQYVLAFIGSLIEEIAQLKAEQQSAQEEDEPMGFDTTPNNPTTIKEEKL